MDDDFDPQLADRFRVLDRVAVPTTWSPADATVATLSPRRGRSMVFAAAAVVAIALVGVAVFTRDRGASVAGPSGSASTTAAPTTAPPATSSTATTAPAAPPPEIDWQMVRPEGSIASSGVEAVVSGPNGFVATGMGLEDGKNWGRVWHSTDGVTWTEPAVDVFGARWVGTPIATSTGYFVIAWPNTDRADAPVGVSLFHSIDGENWQSIAPADGLQLLGVAGDRLVAMWTGAPATSSGGTIDPATTAPSPTTELRVSLDGVEWVPAVFEDGTPQFATYGWTVSAGGRSYLNGFANADDLAVWESENGLEWHRLPALPDVGILSTLGDAPAIIANPRMEECSSELTLPTISDGQFEEGAFDDYFSAMWECGGLATIWRWDGNDWVMVTAAGPGPSPVLGTVLPFAGQLVAPVVTPDRWLSASASADGVVWEASGVRAALPGESGSPRNGGSPQMAIAAASADVAVFITPGGMGVFTNLLVGTPVPAPTVQPMTGLLAIGESVMIGAIAELEAAGFVLDAKEGRGPEGARNAIQRHLDDGTLPDTVVIQVGTNAPLRQEELDAILDLLVGRTVVMLTVHAPDIAYIDANNQLIRALPEQYPNVKVADWDALVDGGTVTLTPDGIHLGQDGPAPYVQLILDTLAAAAAAP